MGIVSIKCLVSSGPLADIFGYQPPRPQPQPDRIPMELLAQLLQNRAVDDEDDLEDADPVAIEKTTAAKLKGNRFLPISSMGPLGKLFREGIEGIGKGMHQFLGGVLQGGI